MQNLIDTNVEGVEIQEKSSVWHDPPFILTFLAKLSSKQRTNCLIASSISNSGETWRLFTQPINGFLTFAIKGIGDTNQQLVNTRVDICDGKWHRIQLGVTTDRLSVSIDNITIIQAESTIALTEKAGNSTCVIGFYPHTHGTCDGQIADISLYRGGNPVFYFSANSDSIKRIRRFDVGAKTSPVVTVGDSSGKIKSNIITFPDFSGATAVWGAIGRDKEGQIWMSASSHDVKNESAWLYRYSPTQNTLTLMGDALTELKYAKMYQPKLQQAKIHTKFIQGNDGYLYFGTMSEPKSGHEGDILPPHGSHLWRIKPSLTHWEHLVALPEGLISLAGNGNVLFGLAFPDHTLIRFDITSRTAKRVAVGTVEGHISRFMICDYRGHAYVPRMRYKRANDAAMTLVEFDSTLKEVAEFPLPYYKAGPAELAHGIIAVQTLADRSIAFTTSAGRLFCIDVPNNNGPSTLHDFGWYHPKGTSYASGLFLGRSPKTLVGIAQVGREGTSDWNWVTFDLATKRSTAIPLPLDMPVGWPKDRPLLYGCGTQDNQGSYYLGGAYRNEGLRWTPVVLKIRELKI